MRLLVIVIVVCIELSFKYKKKTRQRMPDVVCCCYNRRIGKEKE